MWIIILLRQGPFPREIVQFIAGLSQLSEVFFWNRIFFTPIIRVNEALNHPQIFFKKDAVLVCVFTGIFWTKSWFL